MEQLQEQILTLASVVDDLSHDDIPALGTILSQIEAIEAQLPADAQTYLSPPIQAGKHHAEQLILENTEDTAPLSEAVAAIQNIAEALAEGRTPSECYTAERRPEENQNQAVTSSDAGGAPLPDETGALLGEEDYEIVESFVSEAMDNLDSIEANLVELEEHPDEKSVIDAIFRPFHTIKGVAGFIDLQKISKLAHSTENLLDQARMGVLSIDASATNLVLESVDLLKLLIQRVDEGLAEKRRPIDDDIDIAFLVEKIDDRVSAAQMITESRLGNVLIEQGAITEECLYQGLMRQQATPGKKLGEILVEDEYANIQQISSALDEQKKIRNTARKSNIKVDTEKLDNLIDLTGELVISQSMLRQGVMALAEQSNGNQEMLQALNQLKQIVSGIQKISMSMRMVPVKHTFQKMRRVVRDVAQKSQKSVSLVLCGEETEIDKTVVDALYDPLVHMMRNSVDHGIGTPEERHAADKPEQGTIWLSAYNKAGNIIIEIEDDGKGLNKNAILKKALAGGIISKEAAEELSDDAIYELVMQAGFSTADQVSDVSGRGVGMDVVKQSVERLNGKLDVKSSPGLGTRFIISLPLTLAIIDGMLVRVGDEKYIIPTMSISIAFRPGENDYHTVKGKGEMIQTRNGLLPLLRFDRLFHISNGCNDPRNGLVVVAESRGEQKCLLIDELLGKEEFVIKNIGDSLKGIDGIAGGAILGDGHVGLILDIEGLFKAYSTG
ncbi:MAG: chemotaxis protein CheA [Thermodesulfobacteriota bacterium]|nr:chemotaxis protein CheA [Thermodesulfobacteriota bacterium]